MADNFLRDLPVIGWMLEWVDPITQANRQSARSIAPTNLPDAREIIAAFTRGRLSRQTAQGIAASIGARWEPFVNQDGSDYYKSAWKAVEDLYRGVPSVGDYSLARFRDLITETEWRAGLKRNGVDLDRFASLWPSTFAFPTLDMVQIGRLRGVYPDDDAWKRALSTIGYKDNTHLPLLRELLRWIPTPSDLVQFAVKDVFDPETVKLLKSYAEYPSFLTPWFQRQGMVYPLPDAPQGEGIPADLHWGHAFWGQHWRNLAPGQVYRFWHLFRPDRIERYRGRGLDIQPWGLAESRQALKIADYPPGLRDYLTAAAYNPIRLFDIRNAIILGVRKRPWAREQLLDRGYHPDDVEDQLDLLERQKQERYFAGAKALYKAALTAAAKLAVERFRDGFTTRIDALQELMRLGLEDFQANVVLDEALAARTQAHLRAGLKAIRSDFMRGGLSEEEAVDALRLAGVQPEPARDEVNGWKILRSFRFKMVSTADVLRWHKEGLISQADALTRLERIGWTRADSLLKLTEVRIQQERAGVRFLQAGEANRRRAARELQQSARQLASQQRQIQSELRRLQPVATLSRWLGRGIVSVAYFRRALIAQGYPPDIIERYLAAALGGQRNGQREPEAGGAPAGEGQPP